MLILGCLQVLCCSLRFLECLCCIVCVLLFGAVPLLLVQSNVLQYLLHHLGLGRGGCFHDSLQVSLLALGWFLRLLILPLLSCLWAGTHLLSFLRCLAL